MRKIMALLFVAGMAWLLFWPVSIEPRSWTPPDPPELVGVLAPNDALSSAERFAQAHGRGGEATTIDAQGRVVTGWINGQIVRVRPDGSAHEVIADTGGRPLGMKFAADGRLIVADAARGLLAVDAGQVSVLLDEQDGVPVNFADDLTISRDQVVYFSDASLRFGYHDVRADFFEHAPNGRLIAFDLRTGVSRTLLDDMYFANGVALGPDDAYLLVNETSKYRVRRYWLRGPEAGRAEIFIDNLPGLPDNITASPRGTFWVALYGPRSKPLDQLLSQPFLRKMVWRLPAAWQPDPERLAWALEISAEGEIMRSLQGRGEAAFAPVTSVLEHAGHIYLGSLSASGLARYALEP